MSTPIDFEITAITLQKYFSKEVANAIRGKLCSSCPCTTRQIEYSVWRQGSWRIRSSDIKHYKATEVEFLCRTKLEDAKLDKKINKDAWKKILHVVKEELKLFIKEQKCNLKRNAHSVVGNIR